MRIVHCTTGSSRVQDYIPPVSANQIICQAFIHDLRENAPSGKKQPKQQYIRKTPHFPKAVKFKHSDFSGRKDQSILVFRCEASNERDIVCSSRPRGRCPDATFTIRFPANRGAPSEVPRGPRLLQTCGISGRHGR